MSNSNLRSLVFNHITEKQKKFQRTYYLGLDELEIICLPPTLTYSPDRFSTVEEEHNIQFRYGVPVSSSSTNDLFIDSDGKLVLSTWPIQHLMDWEQALPHILKNYKGYLLHPDPEVREFGKLIHLHIRENDDTTT